MYVKFREMKKEMTSASRRVTRKIYIWKLENNMFVCNLESKQVIKYMYIEINTTTIIFFLNNSSFNKILYYFYGVYTHC